MAGCDFWRGVRGGFVHRLLAGVADGCEGVAFCNATPTASDPLVQRRTTLKMESRHRT
jgi:hypothetical protein